MPIYEYACGSCGHRFEAKQRFSDDPIASCPECGQTVRRVFHPAGIIFKGSGFYINDSRNSNSSGTSNGSTGAKSSPTPDATASSDASAATATETKSEAKSETVSSSSDSKTDSK